MTGRVARRGASRSPRPSFFMTGVRSRIRRAARRLLFTPRTPSWIDEQCPPPRGLPPQLDSPLDSRPALTAARIRCAPPHAISRTPPAARAQGATKSTPCLPLPKRHKLPYALTHHPVPSFPPAAFPRTVLHHCIALEPSDGRIRRLRPGQHARYHEGCVPEGNRRPQVVRVLQEVRHPRPPTHCQPDSPRQKDRCV